MGINGDFLQNLSIRQGNVSDKALKQIIGEVGAENLPKIKDNLQVARDMEAAGKTPKEIWLATGWERTKNNGKWKYDLPDVEFNNFVSVLNTILGKQRKDGDYYATTIGDVVNGGLLKAYPELKDFGIEFINDKNNKNYGEYRPNDKDITGKTRERIIIKFSKGSIERFIEQGALDKEGILSNPNSSESAIRKIYERGYNQLLVHELRHYIQFELFAKGGNADKKVKEILESQRGKDIFYHYQDLLYKAFSSSGEI
ncbi:MAG: hypothetical protein KIT66_08355 [Chitinophagaceae bacterium]|nr:hypothetical protein [Chitinophagaceae bacterium]MCZ2395288.1 hypothetical protein [Chitinophagales bacterium]